MADVLRQIYAELGEEGVKKARWQERMRALSFLLQLLFLVVYVALWLFAGWAAAAARWTGENPWLFALLFFAGDAVFTLPLRYLSRWVELRLGTNRQSLGGWVLDWLKNSALNVVLMGLLFGTAFALYQRWPEAALFGAVAVAVAFALLLFALQPLMLRMEYKTEPLEDPGLRAIGAVFEKAGVPFKGLFLVRAGEKTSRGNAAVVPKAGGYEVVFFDTLLEALDPDALAFVVAHELGHVKHRDARWQIAVFSALLFFALLMGQLAVRLFPLGLGLPLTSVASLPLFYLGVMLAFLVGNLLINAFTRTREYAADRFAFELTGDLGAFERSFTVLAKQNFADPDPPAWVELLLHDHPSIKHRLEAGRRYFEGAGRGSA